MIFQGALDQLTVKGAFFHRFQVEGKRSVLPPVPHRHPSIQGLTFLSGPGRQTSEEPELSPLLGLTLGPEQFEFIRSGEFRMDGSTGNADALPVHGVGGGMGDGALGQATKEAAHDGAPNAPKRSGTATEIPIPTAAYMAATWYTFRPLSSGRNEAILDAIVHDSGGKEERHRSRPQPG